MFLARANGETLLRKHVSATMFPRSRGPLVTRDLTKPRRRRQRKRHLKRKSTFSKLFRNYVD